MPIHELLAKALQPAQLELWVRLIERPKDVGVFTRQNKSRATRIASALHRLGYGKFRSYWIIARLQVDLQMRLYVETILFSMGTPWSDLVSGFKPLRTPLGPYK